VLQDLKFSRWWAWSWSPIGMWCCVIRWKCTNVSEDYIASTIRVYDNDPTDGGTRSFWNIRKLLLAYMTSHPRSQPSLIHVTVGIPRQR